MGHGKPSASIAIFSANGLLREGLSRILSSNGYGVLEVDGNFSSDKRNFEPQSVDLAVIDATSHSPSEAVDEIERCKQRFPSSRIVVLRGAMESRQMVALLKAGANACLASSATPETLLKTIEVVLPGETIFPQDILPQLLAMADAPTPPCARDCGHYSAYMDTGFGQQNRPGAKLPHLSAQEKRILRRLIVGDSNKLIARNLEIAETTVKVHVKAIFRKLGLSNRTQAAVWGLNEGHMLLDGSEESTPAPTPKRFESVATTFVK